MPQLYILLPSRIFHSVLESTQCIFSEQRTDKLVSLFAAPYRSRSFDELAIFVNPVVYTVSHKLWAIKSDILNSRFREIVQTELRLRKNPPLGSTNIVIVKIARQSVLHRRKIACAESFVFAAPVLL